MSNEPDLHRQEQIEALRRQVADLTDANHSLQSKLDGLQADPSHEHDPCLDVMMQCLNDVVWSASGDGRTVQFMNRAVETVYGRTAAEFKANPNLWQEVVYCEDRHLVAAASSQLSEQRQVSLEYRIVRSDGELRWIHDSKALIVARDGSPLQMGGVARDITDRKLAEAELAALTERLESHVIERTRQLSEADERFRHLAENIDDVFWLMNWIDHQVIYVSPSFENVWGLSAEHVYENPDAWMEIIHPDDRQRVAIAFAEKAEQGDFDEQYRIVRPDGSIRWIRDHGFPVQGVDGEVVRLAGIAEDITEKKVAADKLRQREVELAHASRVTVLGEMASALAHELNQPLGSIAGNAQACVRGIRSGNLDKNEMLEALDDIANESLRAGEILRGVTRFICKKGPVRQLVNINEQVQDAVRILQPEVEQSEARILLDLGQSLPSIIGDAVQVQQVLINLVRNALESMTHDEPDDGVVVLRSSSENNNIVISVSDTGEAFAGESLDDIFQPYFTTKTEELGMGLSISRTIVNANGGRLWATHNTGPGMTFSLSLPISQEHEIDEL